MCVAERALGVVPSLFSWLAPFRFWILDFRFWIEEI
jgi:hypothetical protein